MFLSPLHFQLSAIFGTSFKISFEKMRNGAMWKLDSKLNLAYETHF